MEKWIDVVTNPLGLAGFALFLVFTVFSRVGGKNRPSWLMPTFVGMALISLVGGLWLAASSQQGGTPGGASSVTQTTSGHQSPAITGVTGNVTITVTDKDDEKGTKR